MELKKLNEEGEYPQEALLTFHISDPSAWGDGIAVGFADCRRGDERSNKTNAAPRRASASGPARPSAGPGWRCGFLPCKGRMIQSELESPTATLDYVTGGAALLAGGAALLGAPPHPSCRPRAAAHAPAAHALLRTPPCARAAAHASPPPLPAAPRPQAPPCSRWEGRSPARRPP